MQESQSSNQSESDNESQSDVDLRMWVAEAARGNRAYQRLLYEQLAPRLYRVIRKIVGPDDADDVMQDFVVQWFSKLINFDLSRLWKHGRTDGSQSKLAAFKKKASPRRATSYLADHAVRHTAKSELSIREEQDWSMPPWKPFQVSSERYCK